MIATSKHNKYVSIPDWFGSSSNESTTSETAASTTTVVISGGGNTGGISGGGGGSTEIPIDNRTIVWSNSLLTVPIDDDKIIVKDGKITTSTTSGLWELREASDGSSYIYTTYPVATQQGITMYVDNNDLDLPSIYDGLPIDNVTIYWALDDNGNKVLKSIGQSGGGVADRVAWVNITGKPSWLLDDKIQYTEIEGTPDLSGFITKAYVDDNFVTFSLNEEISGIKSFTNGLKIGESLIKQLQNDVVYIDANLVVRGGVTMYYDDGEIDIPNIQDQIGSAGYNEKGLASFDQTYFTINDGHVSLIEDAVGLNEDELLNYLTNNKYATQSWVETRGYALNSDLTTLSTKVNDFLEGSDTDNIINKWKELEAFLTGLDGSNDLATILSWKADKTYVDETFVTIGGDTEQTITGPKNFTGGLKVNGSPIYYDPEKKYWKLEGDLLVTGGVTMYGNDSEFTPSTIMDAIAVDGTTVSKEGGILKVIGSVGGATTLGGLANVGSWADSVASQDRIMYQAANSSQWVAKNLSDLTVGGVTGDYLPLTGGTLTNTLTIDNSTAGLILHRSGQATPYIRFGQDTNNEWGELGVYNDGRLVFWPLVSSQGGYGQWNTILHAGNYSSYALPLSGGTLSGDLLFDNSNHNRIIMSRGGNYAAIGNNFNKLLLEFKYATYLTYHGMMIDEYGLNYTLRTDNSTIEKYKVWNEYNDGSGSGLDADMLDGKHSYDFFRKVAWNPDINSYGDSSNANGIIYINTSDNDAIHAPFKYGSILSMNYDAASWMLSCSSNGLLGFRHRWWSGNGTAWSDWKTIALTDSNVASATKLQTARTIWGQSFDGTGNVDGRIRVFQDVASNFTEAIISSFLVYSKSPYGLVTRAYYNGSVSLQSQRESDNSETFSLILNPNGGNVGIGTTSPANKLDVKGSSRAQYMEFWNTSFNGNAGYIGRGATNNNDIYIFSSGSLQFGVNGVDRKMTLDTSANLLVTGGVTMYSDARKKTILNHVELSLKQIAEAPLIEHYYNSDENKTTHVGSIAQYWAGLNDWFCKLDNEGYYTMEIQNAALASAISVARELVKFETETDRRIRLLEEENEQLKKEIEILKWNIA